jgi:hypothetical protein
VRTHPIDKILPIVWPVSTFPLTVGCFSHSPRAPISLGWGDYVFLTPARHIVYHARHRVLHDGNQGDFMSSCA